MALTKEEINAANRERIDSTNRDKAESWNAQKFAAAQQAEVNFALRHKPGETARLNGEFYYCTANSRLMSDWLADHANGEVTEESLERAYRVLQASGKLAQAPAPAAYERHTNTQESRISPQIKAPTLPALRLPYTRKDILSWSKSRLKAEMKSPAHVAAINAILAER